jgi:hypothetical protein
MDHGDLAVPRDRAEAQKWNRQAGGHTWLAPSGRLPLILLLVALPLALVAFVWGMVVLPRRELTGWKQLLFTSLVHLVGFALVLNSINTYGFQFFFPKCTHGFLATSCYEYGSGPAAHVLQALGDYQVVNLIFRFMMGLGFGLDVLAIWYVVYIYRSLIRGKAQPSRNAEIGRLPG